MICILFSSFPRNTMHVHGCTECVRPCTATGSARAPMAAVAGRKPVPRTQARRRCDSPLQNTTKLRRRV